MHPLMRECGVRVFIAVNTRHRRPSARFRRTAETRNAEDSSLLLRLLASTSIHPRRGDHQIRCVVRPGLKRNSVRFGIPAVAADAVPRSCHRVVKIHPFGLRKRRTGGGAGEVVRIEEGKNYVHSVGRRVLQSVLVPSAATISSGFVRPREGRSIRLAEAVSLPRSFPRTRKPASRKSERIGANYAECDSRGEDHSNSDTKSASSFLDHCRQDRSSGS